MVSIVLRTDRRKGVKRPFDSGIVLLLDFLVHQDVKIYIPEFYDPHSPPLKLEHGTCYTLLVSAIRRQIRALGLALCLERADRVHQPSVSGKYQFSSKPARSRASLFTGSLIFPKKYLRTRE